MEPTLSSETSAFKLQTPGKWNTDCILNTAKVLKPQKKKIVYCTPKCIETQTNVSLANFFSFWFNLVNIYINKQNSTLQFLHIVSYINVNESDIHARSQQIPYSSKFLSSFKDI